MLTLAVARCFNAFIGHADRVARPIVISVVNRHHDETIAADIERFAGDFAGPASVNSITNDDVSNQP